jgi:hypothetical protein
MKFVVSGVLALALAVSAARAQDPAEYDFLIKSGHVIDPKSRISAVSLRASQRLAR